MKFAKARMAANGKPQIEIAIPSFGYKNYEAWLAAHGRVSRIHRKKPKGKPQSEALRAANRAKSKILASVKHVFAQQKAHMGLFVRTIGIKRAETKIMLANLAYNMQRLIFHERRLGTG